MNRRAPVFGHESLDANIAGMSKLGIDKLRKRWKATFCVLVVTMFVASSLIGSSCGVDYANQPPEVAAQAVEVNNSPFDREISYTGPQLRAHQSGELLGYELFRLRGWKDKVTGLAHDQLYIESHYSGQHWRFYQSANFEGGEFGNFVAVDKQVSDCQVYELLPDSCDYSETFGVDISDEFLRAHSQTGFSSAGASAYR